MSLRRERKAVRRGAAKGKGKGGMGDWKGETILLSRYPFHDTAGKDEGSSRTGIFVWDDRWQERGWRTESTIEEVSEEGANEEVRMRWVLSQQARKLVRMVTKYRALVLFVISRDAMEELENKEDSQ